MVAAEKTGCEPVFPVTTMDTKRLIGAQGSRPRSEAERPRSGPSLDAEHGSGARTASEMMRVLVLVWARDYCHVMLNV